MSFRASGETSLELLVVADRDLHACALRRTLGEVPEVSGEVCRTRTLSGALEHLRREDPDVVLVDLHLPDSSGPETAERIVDAVPRIPVVVLAARRDRDAARRSLKRGARDYLITERLGPDTLLRALRAGSEGQRPDDEARDDRRYRDIFQAWPDGAIIVDRRGRIREVNDRAEEIFGYRAEELRGREVETLLPEGCRSRHRSHRERYAPATESRPMGNGRELVGLRADGTRIGLEIGLSTLQADGNGRTVVTVRDVSTRRTIERRLRRSQRDLRKAQRIAGVGNWAWDVDSGELTWSDEVFRIVGHEPEAFEPTYEFFLDMVHPEDRERVEQALGRALAGEEQYDLSHRLVRPDGEVRWVREKAEVARDSSGRPHRIFGVVHDITRERRMRRKMALKATHDSLTELPNRRLFWDRASTALSQTGEDTTVAMLFLDLDRFKAVNDSLGHAAGDRLLRAVASRLEHAITERDTVARIGGDEFAILLVDEHHGERARDLAEELTELFGSPFYLEENEHYQPASIGLATAKPDEVADVEELLHRADAAMYRSKEKGGTRYVEHDPAVDDRHSVRLRRERDLRRAIENEEFSLRYQPVHDLETGEVRALEALARWEPPGEQVRPPSEFIPLAEERGLIIPLGKFLLRMACREMARLRQLDPALDVPLLVNVSARQFGTSDFAETVVRTLEDCHLEADRLKVEVTEGVLMKAAEQLETVSSLGVEVLVDDFGTGYSSLRYLKTLDVSQLKIDRSFVRNLPEDSDDRAIVEMILELARTLGLGVVGEGIETEDQLEGLRRLGCRSGQGFHLSRPRAAEALVGYA